MAQQQKKGSGGNKKIGRDKEKCKRYLDRNTRIKNKIKRILKSNGIAEAQRYAKDHGVILKG